jgi:hypothetical protein
MIDGYYVHMPREEAVFHAVFRSIKGEGTHVLLDAFLMKLDNEEAFDFVKSNVSENWGAWDNQVELKSLP